MPMYEYACQDCGQSFEKRLRMSQASDAQDCPACGSSQTRKLISSAFAVGGGSKTVRRVAPPPSSPFS